jgi:rubrerythrin
VELKDSKTYKNLQVAFSGESEARNKYTYYASQARKEGYNQIGEVFEELALYEKEHAKIWFKLLHHGIGSTAENLKDAINGEHYESTVMYPHFAAEAREENFEKIAQLFEAVGKIEQEHESRYKNLLKELESEEFFSKEVESTWICVNCGYVHFANQALEICPVCSHPQGYFKLLGR